jgi:hypothetical protein
MESTMSAIEMTGTIDEERRLVLDGPVPVAGPLRVRVLVLYPLSQEDDEQAWLRAASCTSAFEFLQEPEEDIYTRADGQPFVERART